MASVDVPVALLGYGTVGSAVNRLLTDSADDIERATGHRLRVVHALVRDTGKERDYPPSGGVLTSDIGAILDDLAEVRGEDARVGGEAAFLARVAHERADDAQPVACRPLDLVCTFRDQPADGRAYGSVAEERDGDVNRRHRPTEPSPGSGLAMTVRMLQMQDLTPDM